MNAASRPGASGDNCRRTRSYADTLVNRRQTPPGHESEFSEETADRILRRCVARNNEGEILVRGAGALCQGEVQAQARKVVRTGVALHEGRAK